MGIYRPEETSVCFSHARFSPGRSYSSCVAAKFTIYVCTSEGFETIHTRDEKLTNLYFVHSVSPH